MACNNYEVIDMGVMVPVQDILARARSERVDIIGLSGLITPSLEEMVEVAKFMHTEGFDIPLLIGGATTSRLHTALKIAPAYADGVVMHVLDASRSAPAVADLLHHDKKHQTIENLKSEQMRVRHQYQTRSANKNSRALSLKKARQNSEKIEWTNYTPPQPKTVKHQVWQDYPLEKLLPYIDWTPFFSTWMLSGKYPNILEDKVVGQEAQKLFADAQQMLEVLVSEKKIRAAGTMALYRANSRQDDVDIYDNKGNVIATFCFLRQQQQKAAHLPNRCLADWIAPKQTGLEDYIGLFAVTAGIGAHQAAQRYEKKGDDYTAIMIKALADRLAEAFAEHLHARVRKEFWGYAPNENLDNTDLISEKYQGIRPAPGYPACPNHIDKILLFKLLKAQKIGLRLTDLWLCTPPPPYQGSISQTQTHAILA